MRTQIYTYFTKPTGISELLYSAESWVQMTLVLETAGPVSFGTSENVSPVLSGKGILLPPTGVPIEVYLPKGNRIFIAANAINRVKVIIEPLPWLEQIAQQVGEGLSGLRGTLGAAMRKVGGGGGGSGPAPSKGGETPCPPTPVIPPFWRK